ncbi:chemotaxis protein CheD [Lachnospiraceae bacterium PM6-15]|uniref:Probable chemoreceptor glutamine deamidase CheD n=1 Tax=Ohessyouella blattaphilus TaxID=2949333 RepID=A0ABT1EHG5_9FIRM|nr:chemotaxis protein CheD [Ohessyouella blattaphilus]MCP1109141.1 chemotaxis protein CheD [Ohessyouella blattaphilus]MCR8562535.1 chemotaxis protein CheD [Ohessyouella blattaphilus]MDL2250243.1 chemotaxis protein CheD [Lachnospiraceae bacterium OttesenSCG-928-J05]
MNRDLCVGIADMKFVKETGSLITYALGSCIGVSFHDPLIKLTALLHILLPESNQVSNEHVYKFADSGIRETLRILSLQGGAKSRYVCKVAGGAQMFQLPGNSPVANIGKRNFECVQKILQSEGLRISNAQVGGTIARTMRVEAATGVVQIRTHGLAEIIM